MPTARLAWTIYKKATRSSPCPWAQPGRPAGPAVWSAGLSARWKATILNNLTNGNREETARLLGIGERTLYRVIQDWKVQDRIKEALAQAAGNLDRAADILKMKPAALQRKLKKLGLQA